jgi:hypothetical protein
VLEPVLSLAFSLHHNKRTYALLVGSGVSRAATVPTGWDVVRDLVKRVAVPRARLRTRTRWLGTGSVTAKSPTTAGSSMT